MSFNFENDWLSIANFIINGWKAGLRKFAAGDGRSIVIESGTPGDQHRNYVGLSGSGMCSRANAFAVNPEIPRSELNIDTLHGFADGHVLEAHTKRVMEYGGINIELDQMVVAAHTPPDGLPIIGHVDGVVWLARYEDDGSGDALLWRSNIGPTNASAIGLFEHKTLRAFPYKKLLGKGNDNVCAVRKDASAFILHPGTMELVSPHNYAQMQAYMYTMEHNCNLDEHPIADFGIYFGRSREANSVAVEIIPYVPMDGEMFIHEMISVAQHVDDGMLPPRGYDLDKDWQCKVQYCRYRATCEKAGPGPRSAGTENRYSTYGPMPIDEVLASVEEQADQSELFNE